MISFISAVAVLILGFCLYGRLTEKIFAPDDRPTPAIANNDGVDCVPMKTWRAFMIQLLNIAGTGPIFGALMGAVFGPVVFLWIVFGSILGGAVHDYMTGMISSRYGGASIAEISGILLGKPMKWVMRIFSLVLVGTVFVESPAALLSKITPEALDIRFWTIVIVVYYLLATILPINKIIGRFYPIFGIVLISMAISMFIGVIGNGYSLPELRIENLHPDNLPTWPFMLVTVACGAISGFHATQSPMVAKCITSEKKGRRVFYGAMLAESIIALVWAAAGVAFYGTTEALSTALTANGQSGVVYEIATGLLGRLGEVLAILGVIACPITSGDTAFRAARLIIAEMTHLDQKKIKNRLVIAIPLLLIGTILTNLDFSVLWRYFSWSNQMLATTALWCSTVYLVKFGKYRFGSLITALPATFMTAVSFTYILVAEEGPKLPHYIAYPAGILAAAVLLFIYFRNLIIFLRKKGLKLSVPEKD